MIDDRPGYPADAPVGSTAWHRALSQEGGTVNVVSFLQNWQTRAKIYQDETKKFWLYP